MPRVESHGKFLECFRLKVETAAGNVSKNLGHR